MFDFEPSEEQVRHGHYMSTIKAVDELGEMQTLCRSIAMLASNVGNKHICNELLAASDVLGDCRNSLLLLNDKIMRDIRDAEK